MEQFLVISNAFAAGAAGGGLPESLSPYMSLLPWVVIFAIFYFVMIMPQMKRQKKHKSFLEGLKKGDKVVTSGGIIGTIESVTDKIITLRIAENCKIKILKDTVAGAYGGEE
jgi:preprotein translocase subunit YajC